MSGRLVHTDGMDEQQPSFDDVLLFVGLVLVGVVVLVAALYGFFWLMFDAGN
jgi:hypothetical protein